MIEWKGVKRMGKTSLNQYGLILLGSLSSIVLVVLIGIGAVTFYTRPIAWQIPLIVYMVVICLEILSFFHLLFEGGGKGEKVSKEKKAKFLFCGFFAFILLPAQGAKTILREIRLFIKKELLS